MTANNFTDDLRQVVGCFEVLGSCQLDRYVTVLGAVSLLPNAIHTNMTIPFHLNYP
jgi:hypothetical protein